MTPRTLDQLPSFSNADPEYLIRPLEAVDAGRSDWCATDAFGTLLVWSRSQVLEALDHPDLWAPTIEQSSLGAVADGPAAEWARKLTSFQDGADHRRQRAAIGPAFTPGAVEDLRPVIRQAAGEVVTDLTGDLVDACLRYPMLVFAHVLGTSPDELLPLQDDVAAASRLWGYDAGNARARIEEALPALETVASKLRACPAGIVERIERIELDEELRQALVMQLIVAGWETTASQAACVLWTLLGDQDRWNQARSGRNSTEALVLESIRWQPAASGALRFANVDTQLGDVAIPAGTRVFASFLWASRDPDAYRDAATWDPTRYEGPTPEPAPLTFGGGRHRCLGDRLALIELEELVDALIEHGPGTAGVQPTDWTDHRRPRRPLALRLL